MLPLDNPDYRLAWPRELFASELRAVLARSDNGAGWPGRLLLEEAFVGSAPSDAFQSGGWDGRTALADLAGRTDELRDGQERTAPYRLERVRGGVSSGTVPPPDYDGAARRFARLVAELNEHGYLDRAFGRDCVDDSRDYRTLSDALEDALGVGALWPLTPNA